MNNQDQMSLFSTPREKGSGEWAAFSVVRESKPGMFRVLTPKVEQAKRSVIQHFRRQPARPLFPKPAH